MEVDLLTVYLPLLLIVALVARHLARRVEAAFEPEERWLKAGVLVLVALVVGAFGVPLAEMWSWLVETARLRNGHISYRVFRLPLVEHRLEVWLVGAFVFGCVATARTSIGRPRTRR